MAPNVGLYRDIVNSESKSNVNIYKQIVAATNKSWDSYNPSSAETLPEDELLKEFLWSKKYSTLYVLLQYYCLVRLPLT